VCAMLSVLREDRLATSLPHSPTKCAGKHRIWSGHCISDRERYWYSDARLIRIVTRDREISCIGLTQCQAGGVIVQRVKTSCVPSPGRCRSAARLR
jgi:hypothetical protein